MKEGRKAQYKKETQQTSLSRRTVELTRTIIKAALTQAVKEQLIARNPADATELPPADEEKEVIPFTQEEALKFLNSIKGKRLFAAYYLCLATGLRRGELLGLKWEDIDFRSGNFEIKRNLVEVKNETGKYVLEFQKPKTRKSQRTIPMTEDIIKVLKAHKVKQNEEKLFFGKGYQDNGLVFCSEDGRPLWPRNFHRQYSNLLKAAGIPHKKPHAMRHTFVSLLLEQGEDLKNIQELVGHASIVVTANVYGKIAEKTKKKAVEKMSQILKIEAVNR
ncbi:MAG: site-specific integrase [Firmicutes bacterium]|nr:site-specific integrase [Bacillota bacterium]